MARIFPKFILVILIITSATSFLFPVNHALSQTALDQTKHFRENLPPNNILVGPGAGVQAGFSVTSAGDINGDGYADILVGAPLYTDGLPSQGAVLVYFGSEIGLSTSASILKISVSDARFGSSVASAGDINNDGYSDIMVGIPDYDNGLKTDVGAVYIYYGSSQGLTNNPSLMIIGDQANAKFGFSVSSAGDLNADGFDDIVVGAPLYDNGEHNEGAAFVYLGSVNGINNNASKVLEMDQAGAEMGFSVASAGDINNDGFADVLVGSHMFTTPIANNAGAVFVFHGSAIGLTNNPIGLINGRQSGSHFGMSVSTAGDLNADGFSDIVIGAPYYNNGEHFEGVAYVYYGSLFGVDVANFTILEKNQALAEFGFSVASAGDYNGDGYDDIVIGAPFFDGDAGEWNMGAAFLFEGSTLGVMQTAVEELQNNQIQATMGWSVSKAGDVNSDGFSDLLVGSRFFDGSGIDDGAAYIFHGKSVQLPVRLIDFGVVLEARNVLLSWETASEENSERFEIQRSDLAKKWSTIGFLNSKGNVSTETKYQFTDCQPIFGANLYRLKMVDQDGSFAYSKVKSISINQDLFISIFPNPTSDKVFFKCLDRQSLKNIQLISLNGQELHHFDSKTTEIDFRSIPSGLYILIITRSDGSEFRQSIVKQ